MNIAISLINSAGYYQLNSDVCFLNSENGNVFAQVSPLTTQINHKSLWMRGTPIPIQNINIFVDPSSPVSLTPNEFRILSDFITPRKINFKKLDRLFIALIIRRILLPLPKKQKKPSIFELPKNFGLLTIAIGSDYLKLASALAMSAQSFERPIPVSIVVEAGQAKKLGPYSQLFDQIIEIDTQDFKIKNEFSPYFLKTHIYQFSPYSNTLFLDADTILFSNTRLDECLRVSSKYDCAPAVSLIFNPAKEHPRTMWFWGLDAGMLSGMGVKKEFARIHSYYIFFRKNSMVSSYFESVRQLYMDMTLSPTVRKRFSKHIPDEVAWSIASAFTEARFYSGFHMPIAENLYLNTSDISLNLLSKHFYGLTFVGKQFPSTLIDLFNSEVKKYATQLNLPPIPWTFTKEESLC